SSRSTHARSCTCPRSACCSSSAATPRADRRSSRSRCPMTPGCATSSCGPTCSKPTTNFARTRMTMTTKSKIHDVDELRHRAEKLRLYGLLSQWGKLCLAPWVPELLELEEQERIHRSREYR